MSKPVEGWDQEAQDWWDAASPEVKARALREFAVINTGNTRSHLLAAARFIEVERGAA